MFGEILLFLVLFVICFIPILGWGYLFTYHDNSDFNRNRFLIGIFAGIISVFPVLYLGDFINKFDLGFLNPFYYIKNLFNFGEYFYFYGVLIFLVLLLGIIPFIVFNLKNFADLNKAKQKSLVFLKSSFFYSIFTLILVILYFLINFVFKIFPGLDFFIENGVNFLDISFNSLKLVIFYYILVALMEELSKFFSFRYSKYFDIKTIQDGVLFSIFVALGFGFIENILYMKTLYELNDGFNTSVVGIFVSRSVFSIFLHVICTSVFSYFFSKAFLFLKTSKFIFLKTLFLGFIISILLHMTFNVFLTLQIMFIVFLYLILGYFYLTYIFYKE